MSRRVRNVQARSSRARTAKDVIVRGVPAILKADARARRGNEAAELIVDPPPRAGASQQLSDLQQDAPATPTTAPLPRITLRVTNSLEAAHRVLTRPDPLAARRRKPPRVAILNMASPLRPGGGILSGATSQEEWLCSRTTLYPSLREEFYRLPEVGGIYTPDVLVFRQWDEAATELPKADRFFVDVVSAAMLRFPDLDDGDGAEKVYAEQKDRELVIRKMRGVMRILQRKGIEKVVLGAWGCGAYGNPVGEVATAWSRVLLGRKGKGKVQGHGDVAAGSESWEGLEIIFAVKDPKMAKRFATAFGPGIEVEDAASLDGHSESSPKESESGDDG